MMPFLFVDELSTPGIDLRVLRVARDVREKTELLASYREALSFPHGFGMNWDALDDCLHDLSWLAERTILIAHGDVPLKDSPQEQAIYLDILADTVRFWAARPRPEFKVVFPRADRDTLERVLAQ